MSRIPGSARSRAVAMALLASFLIATVATLRADTILLNNGTILRGRVAKDKPLLWIDDGLKRTVIRDSKVKKIESDAAFRGLETFDIDQPLVVHGGEMPKVILSVKAEPWSDRGRRSFAYEGARAGKMIRMEQAINKLGPHIVHFRGIDGFWQGQLETNQVPRDIVLSILSKVQQTDKNERIRVARFLIQAEWYAEASAELDRIAKDFADDADLRERIASARATVAQLDANRVRAAIDRCRSAQQPKEMLNLMRTFPTKDVAGELVVQVRDLLRVEEDQAAVNKILAEDLQALLDKLPTQEQTAWKKHILEALKALKEAPEAVRDRFAAWQKARSDPSKTPEALFSLAMSGYVVGAEFAVEKLDQAQILWTMRDQILAYLASNDDPTPRRTACQAQRRRSRASARDRRRDPQARSRDANGPTHAPSAAG